MMNKKMTAAKRLNAYERLSEAQRRSESAIDLLDGIIQAFVEENDDASACRWQRKKVELICALKGAEHIDAERAGLYLRELEIRSAPLRERTALCRSLWNDLKERYGARSYAVSRLAAPLYLMCCEAAGEYEEMRVLCAEVIALFGDSDDPEEQKLAALCRAFDCVYGRSRKSPDALRALCECTAEQFGENSEVSLMLYRELGLLLRRPDEPDSLNRCVEIHRQCLETAVGSLGNAHRLTLLLYGDLTEELALMKRFNEARAMLKTLKTLCAKAPDDVEKPDVDSVCFTLYSKEGKTALAEKHANRSLKTAVLAHEEADVADKRFQKAALAFLNDRCAEQLRLLTDAVSDKLDAQLLSCLGSAAQDRAAYFENRNGRGVFRIYSVLLLSYLSGEECAGDDLLRVWELLCKEKTYLSDYELLYSAMTRQPEFAALIAQAEQTRTSGDPLRAADCERKVLDALRHSDIPGYSDRIRPADICASLDADEVLLDYYLLDAEAGKEYAVFVAEKTGVRFVRLGSADTLDREISVLTEKILNRVITNNVINDIPAAHFGIDLAAAGQYKTVYLCPDGRLYSMPFDLLTSCACIHLTSPKHLPDIKKRDDSPDLSIDSVSVFGDPRFYDRRPPLNKRAARLTPLPGTRIEALLIERCFGEKARLFLSGDATAANFCGVSGDILHIGTHARAEGTGYLYFSDTEKSDACFSGSQIAGMDFSKTRLVTLSACSTADGSPAEYVGVRSLRRAFRLAGAGTVLATLWEIDDFSSILMMKQFYERYAKSGDACTSLEQAKAYLRTVSLRQLREEELPAIFELMLSCGQVDFYRRIRDRFARIREDEKPFAAPYYWAGFGVYE